jgi:uncharacterized protein (TIGR02391 family)
MGKSIPQIVPDVDAFLALEPEAIAGVMLEHLHDRDPSEHQFIHPAAISAVYTFGGYDPRKVEACQKRLVEGWAVLENLGLLVRRPSDGQGAYILSRRGEATKNGADLKHFQDASLFPRDLVHGSIRTNVYSLFVQGDYEMAVLKAYRLVEIAVRDACGPGYKEMYGVELIRAAFHTESGPLTRRDEQKSEREALSHLFAGAIGRFKNPSSHRHVVFNDPREAIEMILFANHLLRIVEERRNARAVVVDTSESESIPVAAESAGETATP